VGLNAEKRISNKRGQQIDEAMPMKFGRARTRAIVEALLTVIIWGATFVATKIALQEVSPAAVVWLRFAMGLVVLGTAARLRKELSLPARGEWGYLALLGFIGVALHQWLQANGLLTAQATTTAWIVATTPIFIVLLGWIILRERVTPMQGLGIGLAALGVLLVVTKGDPAALVMGRVARAGDVLVLISALNWAVYTVLSRRGLARMPAAQMMFFVMLCGWLFVSIWLLGFGSGLQEFGQLSAHGWIAIAGLGIFGSGLAYITYYDALRVLPASQLGVFLNIEPLVTMLLAAPLLSEPITLITLLGGGLIMAGIYLVNRRQAAPAQSAPGFEPQE
jgi:drug/metabolite transporter (DMT)-like permease